MKKIRSIPRILKINSVNGYRASLLFNNGESRIVDFYYVLLNLLKKSPGKLGYELIENPSLFSEIKVIENSIGWESIGKEIKDFSGKLNFYPYQIDPLILYENSEPDHINTPPIGKKIKSARLKSGMTQSELALKSGTSKHYISRLENNKSDIELLTLKKIVEAGLGKKLVIEFD